MKERSPEMSAVRKVEEEERKRRGATSRYMKGEIDLEEYREIIDSIPGIDLRAIAAWQIRREREIKIDRAREKVRGFVNKVKEKLS